ncbi:MAG: DUF4442 domain-containing protein [Haloarculaceae archaeon]
MDESLKTRLSRYYFNLFPAYRRTGGRVAHIAADWSTVRVAVPLNRRTKNYMGTIFGGSLYGAVDPVYAMMLIKRLGEGYEVWDKAARIEFRNPGVTGSRGRSGSRTKRSRRSRQPSTPRVSSTTTTTSTSSTRTGSSTHASRRPSTSVAIAILRPSDPAVR